MEALASDGEGFVDGTKVTTENLTVFKGVELTFEGHFYCNVDTRDFSRRPWDGRVDPKPNSKYDPNIPNAPFHQPGYKGLEFIQGITPNASPFNMITVYLGRFPTPQNPVTPAEQAAFTKAVDQSVSLGYASAISFESGDNAAITKYKSWTPAWQVVVKTVFGKEPRIDLVKDPLKGAKLKIERGKLENIDNAGDYAADLSEYFRLPKINIGDYLIFESPGKAQDTEITVGAAPPVSSTVLEAIPSLLDQEAALDSAIADQGDIGQGGTNQGNSGFKELLDAFKNRGSPPPAFNSYATWKNSDMNISKGTKSGSIAADCIFSEKNKDGKKYEIQWGMTSYFEFTFRGQLANGIIQPK